ncbi:MAG: hypothetical protein ACI9D0_000987 [Bacteroidia bacterium]|jgi:hypothetical protein
MKAKILAALVALASLAAPSAAQTITFTANIEPATLATFCMEETHIVSSNGSMLRSLVLDLDKYVGKPWEFTATLAGVECPIWYVTEAKPAKGTLVFCGNPVPGCPIRMRVGPTDVIGQWLLWYSATPGFLAIDPVLGTAMLGGNIRFLATGNTFGTTATYDANLPTAPGLVGLTIYAQGARRDTGKIGPFTLTNPVSFKILGPSPPCIVPDC